MTPSFAFQLANIWTVAGWLILAAGIVLRQPMLRDKLAGQAWPLALAGLYLVLVAAFFFQAKGGFNSLADVQLLFTSPWAALAGWVHYLAFDLFVGSYVAREVMELGLPRATLLVLLPLTFLFGPIGLFVHFICRTALAPSSLV